MPRHHEIADLYFEGELMVMTIDGEVRRFPLHEVSPALAKATERERNTFAISPSGYGIHWPLLDEDVSVDGLLGVIHSPDVQHKTS
ncbi:MAG: DUF2442 domain-containing protein [Candidatus Tectomicrobia bacterium]|nr:DUF2442 domain-containing protein [Candidatus Tectomicrobia bacterium]